LDRFIAAEVKAGRYGSPTEVVLEGLRRLKEDELDNTAAQQALRAKIQVGLEQLRRGEGIDGDAAYEQIKAMSRQRRGVGA
jgi:antitoxin ParD1/3/4